MSSGPLSNASSKAGTSWLTEFVGSEGDWVSSLKPESIADLHCLLSKTNSLKYGCKSSYNNVLSIRGLCMLSPTYCSSLWRMNSLCIGCSQSKARAIAGPWACSLTKRSTKYLGISEPFRAQSDKIVEQTTESSVSLVALWFRFHFIKWRAAISGPVKSLSSMFIDCSVVLLEENISWCCTSSGITNLSDEVSNSVFKDGSSAKKQFLCKALVLEHDSFGLPWVTEELVSPVTMFAKEMEDLMHSEISRTDPDWSFHIPLIDQNPMELAKWKLFHTWTFWPRKSSSLQILAPLWMS